jgi:hypothetical protein
VESGAGRQQIQNQLHAGIGPITRKQHLRNRPEGPFARTARPIKHPNEIESAAVPGFRTGSIIADDQLPNFRNCLMLPGNQGRAVGLDSSASEFILITLGIIQNYFCLQ